MNDPHVVSLLYDFTSVEPGVRFKPDAPSIHAVSGPFDCTLSDSSLRAEPSAHYPDSDSAQADLEPYLRAWEAHCELTGLGLFEFRFKNAEVIDRNPTPGIVTGSAAMICGGFILGASGEVIRSTFPQPPAPGFRETAELRSLRTRLRATLSGREMLQAGAYSIQILGSASMRADRRIRRQSIHKVSHYEVPCP